MQEFMSSPTYEEVVELAEDGATALETFAELLLLNFSRHYPHIKIGRAGRFWKTVKLVL